ncbi:DUF1127 domain-containing protein [Dongia mobilis]|jgi:uncharacterized protein YjiS (DUF1127 family)|uniref:DUF1127 domain-containing protein n=1 Tax=Dongia sp. TaxID=1977262 RepID=UPI0026F26C71
MTQISLFSGSQASSQGASHLFGRPYHASKSVPTGRLGALVVAFLEWQERHRSRRDLMRLSDYQLKDIGLSRLDAEEEYSKPFWRG